MVVLKYSRRQSGTAYLSQDALIDGAKQVSFGDGNNPIVKICR
jgi:hypothetical protein